MLKKIGNNKPKEIPVIENTVTGFIVNRSYVKLNELGDLVKEHIGQYCPICKVTTSQTAHKEGFYCHICKIKFKFKND